MYRIMQTRRLVALGALVLAVSLGVLLFLAPRSSASASGNAFTFTSNGNEAFADWFDGTTSTYGSAEVIRNGSNSKPQTLLFYSLFQVNPCCSFKYGNGLIPNGDFTGSPPTAHLSLNTNTCSDPGFFTFPTGTCGVASVDWQNINEFTHSISGSNIQRYASFTVLFNGDETFSNASASGSFLGSTVAGAYAGMGTFHNAQITIQTQ